jgi:proliferating cell nuclear antigen PCNA
MNIIIRNLQKADCFTSLFQHVRLFTEHINILFEEERMYIQTMDSARVSIFEITLPSSWFDVYELTDRVSIGVNSTMLYKILNTRDKAQEMQILFDEVESDKLCINFTSNNKSIFDKKFEMSLVDLETEVMNIPAKESQAEFSISSVNFANIINQMKLFGDTLEINCTEENITLHSVSVDAGKMAVEINIDDLTSYAINEGERVHLTFSLNLLHNICLYNKLVKDMEIQLTDNFPMKIIFRLDGELSDNDSEHNNDNNSAKMTFYLAPKINDD